MDNELIDKCLIDLLRTPPEQRTKDAIACLISQLATARSLDLEAYYQEHTKLIAMADFLTAESDQDQYWVHLNYCLYPSGPSVSLSLWLASADGTLSEVGYGLTAEEALRDLHTIKRCPGTVVVRSNDENPGAV
jgi:hypothetical protein